MNKYVLIPHEQYESFKSFLADKKDQKIAESKHETVNQNKSDNHKVNIKLDDTEAGKNVEETIGSEDRRTINNNKLDKKSEDLLDSNPKESLSTQTSVRPQNKAAVKHPHPPPGLPAEVVYSKDSILSKITKNGRKIQKGSGGNEWIQKWDRNLSSF